eukprot:5881072-Pyramimonas_sp.AAC.1
MATGVQLLQLPSEGDEPIWPELAPSVQKLPDMPEETDESYLMEQGWTMDEEEWVRMVKGRVGSVHRGDRIRCSAWRVSAVGLLLFE